MIEDKRYGIVDDTYRLMAKKGLVTIVGEAPHGRVYAVVTELGIRCRAEYDMDFESARARSIDDRMSAHANKMDAMRTSSHAVQIARVKHQHADMLSSGMPTVSALMRHIDRSCLTGLFTGMEEGRIFNSHAVFKLVAQAWNEGVIQAIPRNRNDLFLEMRGRLPGVRVRADLAAAKVAVDGLMGVIPVGTTSYDHLVMAGRFLDETRELYEIREFDESELGQRQEGPSPP
jgi:hypothetical protein